MAAFAGLLLAGILSAPIEASEEAIAQRVGERLGVAAAGMHPDAVARAHDAHGLARGFLLAPGRVRPQHYEPHEGNGIQ